MRRLTGLVLSALLMVAALAVPAVAAPGGAGDDVVLLAVDEEPAGPPPMDRLSEDNPSRELAGYEDPETPFTWGAAWLLTFASLMGLALMGGIYYLRVRQPAQEDAQHR